MAKKNTSMIPQLAWDDKSKASVLREIIASDADVGEWNWWQSPTAILDSSFVANVFVFGASALTRFEDKIEDLREIALRIEGSVNVLVNAPQSFTVPINSLAPEPYTIERPLFAVVEPVVPDDPDQDCEYVASVPEASVGASGDTIEEAIRNLKGRLIEKMHVLESLEKPSSALRRQLDILRDVIRKCPE